MGDLIYATLFPVSSSPLIVLTILLSTSPRFAGLKLDLLLLVVYIFDSGHNCWFSFGCL